MKKVLFLMAAFLMIGVTAQAQDWSKWSYGVKGGFNFANIRDADVDMKFSFHAGAFAEYTVNPYLGIQPEILYSRQGAYNKEDGVKWWGRLNYLNVPILAKIYILENLSVNVGPQMGFRLNSRYKTKVGSTKTTGKLHGTEGFDFSFAMGLSYRLDSQWELDARYNLGTTDVFKDFDGKNSVFQLSVGYRF